MKRPAESGRIDSMSKKRKPQRKQAGGRYTPRRSPQASAGTAGRSVGEAHPLHRRFEPTFGGEAGGGDDRSPVDVSLGPPVGTVTMPVAFAQWLGEHKLVDNFAAFVSDLLDRQVHGDMFAAYLEQHPAPLEVVDAVAGFGAYMDAHYGRP